MKKRIFTICIAISIVIYIASNGFALDLGQAFKDSYKAEAKHNYLVAYKIMDKAYQNTKGNLYKYTIRMRIAYLDLLRGKFESSSNNYRAAAKLMKQSIEPYHYMQFHLIKRKKWKALIQASLAGLKVFPSDPTSQSRLAYGLFKSGKYKTAIKEYKVALKQKPLYHALRKMVGWSYLKLKNKNEAKKIFTSILTFAPFDREAKAGLKEAEKK